MKHGLMILVGIYALLLCSCAGQNGSPSYARLQPEQGVTATHPDVLEKKGGTMISFTAILPPQFLVEVKKGVKGVWPLVAGHKSDATAVVEDGFCYAIESRSFNKNPWGIIPLTCTIMGTRKHFEDYRFAIVNKDGGVWIASPAGGVMIDDRHWDFTHFEKKFEERNKVLDMVGQDLTSIDRFWQDRAWELGSRIDGDVKEITINAQNPEWKKFRQSFIAEMGYELKLPDGQVVVSQIPRKDMVDMLSENPRVTRWQKFFAGLSIPIGTPEAMAFGTATSILNSGIAAFINDDMQTRVARGSGLYRDTADQMAFLFAQYQEAHVEMMKLKAGGK